MITYAATRKDEVTKLLTAFSATPEAMYFAPWCYVDFEAKVDENTWAKLQLIAVHEGDIKGYMSATLERGTMSIGQIAVVKFCDGHDLEFAADMATIFRFLRAHFRNIRWSAVVGSPTESFYRRIAYDQNGRDVGKFTQDAKLRDGRICDVCWFEVPGTPQPDCSTMLPPEFGV